MKSFIFERALEMGGWVSKWGGDHSTITFMMQYQNISKNSIGQTFLGQRANTWKLIFDLSPSSALTPLEAGQTLYLSLGIAQHILKEGPEKKKKKISTTFNSKCIHRGRSFFLKAIILYNAFFPLVLQLPMMPDFIKAGSKQDCGVLVELYFLSCS